MCTGIPVLSTMMIIVVLSLLTRVQAYNYKHSMTYQCQTNHHLKSNYQKEIMLSLIDYEKTSVLEKSRHVFFNKLELELLSQSVKQLKQVNCTTQEFLKNTSIKKSINLHTDSILEKLYAELIPIFNNGFQFSKDPTEIFNQHNLLKTSGTDFKNLIQVNKRRLRRPFKKLYLNTSKHRHSCNLKLEDIKNAPPQQIKFYLHLWNTSQEKYLVEHSFSALEKLIHIVFDCNMSHAYNLDEISSFDKISYELAMATLASTSQTQIKSTRNKVKRSNREIILIDQFNPNLAECNMLSKFLRKMQHVVHFSSKIQTQTKNQIFLIMKIRSDECGLSFYPKSSKSKSEELDFMGEYDI